MQAPVHPPLPRQKLGVCALLHHSAGIDHDNAVRPGDRAKSMGNHERSAAAHQAFKGFLHRLLRLAVKRRRRLVQDQYTRVFQNGPCDGDPLALAAAQLEPALAHQCIVPIG